MALTMVHLLAADKWASNHPEFKESPEFYYGVISPDAIHVRDGNDKSHKNEIHLNNWISPHPEDVLSYWRDWNSPFDIGYGVHVLTDGQWVPRYRELLPGIMLPNGKLNVDAYYNDTFVTDFKLYRENPRLEVLLRMIGEAQTPAKHPLLTGYEFGKWRELMLSAYRGDCPKNEPVRFIDEAYINAFVEDCQALIERTYTAFEVDRGAE